jgi:hypothetical protein
MAKADSVHSTPRITASKINPPAGVDARERSCVAGCISATKRAEHFTDLETPMRELRAMVDVVIMVWRHPELGKVKVKHDARVDVVLDELELMTAAMVDDYQAKLEADEVRP